MAAVMQVIDQKSQRTTIGLYGETIDITLTLVEISDGAFGISYQATWSGTYNGSTAGGPQPVSGNGTWTLHDQSPAQLYAKISNYSDDSGSRVISLHIEIDLYIADPGHVFPPIVLFNQTMGGKYGVDVVAAITNHLKSLAAPKE